MAREENEAAINKYYLVWLGTDRQEFPLNSQFFMVQLCNTFFRQMFAPDIHKMLFPFDSHLHYLGVFHVCSFIERFSVQLLILPSCRYFLPWLYD